MPVCVDDWSLHRTYFGTTSPSAAIGLPNRFPESEKALIHGAEVIHEPKKQSTGLHVHAGVQQREPVEVLVSKPRRHRRADAPAVSFFKPKNRFAIAMNSSNIVIFDGVCKFCSGAVNFIIQRDPHAKFRFTPRQGRLGKELMQKHQIQESGGESLILIKDGTYFLRTDAALEIASELSWPWPAFRVFKILPRAFRDFFYRVFARYRYTLFGKRDVCVVPTEDVRSRFIE